MSFRFFTCKFVPSESLLRHQIRCTVFRIFLDWVQPLCANLVYKTRHNPPFLSLFFFFFAEHAMRQDFEILAFELNLSKTSWLISGAYKPPSLSDITFSEIQNILTLYWSTHEIMLLMGDSKRTLDNPNFIELIEDHELPVLISESTCFKSINLTCIDNFLTRKKTRFMNTLTFVTGVWDNHKLIGTMLRSTFAKDKPKKVFYRCYKNFGNETFEEEPKKTFLFSARFWIVPLCWDPESRDPGI